MTTQRVALVTGSNQGIGFQTVRNLCNNLKNDWAVYLLARDETRGKEAVTTLQSEGLQPHFHQLDITDDASIARLRDHIKSAHGGIDILVNNAAMAYKGESTAPDIEQAENTIAVNYTATLNVCNALFPLLREHARVVNVSSCMGELQRVPGPELRAKLKSLDYEVDYLTALATDYVDSFRDNTWKEKGYPASKYTMSKVLVTALTAIQQRNMDKERPGQDIVINAIHPGYVNTSMTSHKGVLSLEEGAKSTTFCALLPKNVEHPRGEYVIENCEIASWER